jgi:hypothetical protein
MKRLRDCMLPRVAGFFPSSSIGASIDGAKTNPISVPGRTGTARVGAKTNPIWVRVESLGARVTLLAACRRRSRRKCWRFTTLSPKRPRALRGKCDPALNQAPGERGARRRQNKPNSGPGRDGNGARSKPTAARTGTGQRPRISAQLHAFAVISVLEVNPRHSRADRPANGRG